jgi:hypothetical protein
MKKEISPTVVGVTIVIVVIVMGLLFYHQAGINPPSAHPHMNFDSNGKPPAPAQGAGGAAH